MKKVDGVDYEIDIIDFKHDALQVIGFAQTMCDTFHTKRIELDEFQREYLYYAIMAGLAQQHRNGFSNGICTTTEKSKGG